MADFSLAQPYIIKNEGGYVNDPSDSGGETYRGISRKNFPKWAGWSTVDAAKPLSRGQIINNANLDGQVSQFYKTNFWDTCQMDAVNNQGFASYFYDFYVTSASNATKCLQRLLGIDTVTGNFGPQTLAGVNGYAGDLLADFHQKRIAYYNDIGTGKNAKFLKGWLNRANFMYDALK